MICLIILPSVNGFIYIFNVESNEQKRAITSKLLMTCSDPSMGFHQGRNHLLTNHHH